MNAAPYRGRLAPSPTGLLHLGHARTFWIAEQRARLHSGTLILRSDDLDTHRCRPEFTEAMIEDLRWLGLRWAEGPDCGGPYAPYRQSGRIQLYEAAFRQLQALGSVYPCTCSRQDVLRALQAPHPGEDEPLYPGTCRPRSCVPSTPADPSTASATSRRTVSWRFRIPDGERVAFHDRGQGPQCFESGRDFGDFVVWRGGLPSYQLACVVDDHAMRITEVVRGADLLRSTVRQLLLYRALGLTPPVFYHCSLVTDAHGIRLAKRHDALSLRALRGRGRQPQALQAEWARLARPDHPDRA